VRSLGFEDDYEAMLTDAELEEIDDFMSCGVPDENDAPAEDSAVESADH
jgi:hypothetical protein